MRGERPRKDIKKELDEKTENEVGAMPFKDSKLLKRHFPECRYTTT
jgi:hypothetical protein